MLLLSIWFANVFTVPKRNHPKTNKQFTIEITIITIENITKDIFSMEGGNASSSNDMYNKSIAMLNDRLEKGTITMDEFNKKCRDIAKKRGNL